MSKKKGQKSGGLGGESIRDRIVDLRRVKACELIPNPKNWRKHPQSQRAALSGILEEVGYVDALLVRETPAGLELIDGHLRAETTPETEVPVLVVDLSEAEADKVLATFDPISAMAKSDADTLDKLLREVETGSQDLAKMLDDLATQAGCAWAKEKATIVEDEAPPAPARPITKPGDLWLLGGHRLLCGDSTSAEDVERLMGGEKAGLCFTSPPYANQRTYDQGQGAGDWDALMRGVFGNLPMAEDGQVLVNLGLVHRDGEWWPYWDGWIEWMRAHGWRRFGWYVWDQGFGLPGDWNGRFGPSHEWIFHFNRNPVRPAKWVDKQPENVKPRNSMESTMRGKDGQTKAFTNPGASGQPTKVPDSVVRIGRQVGSDGHPAQFPVALESAMLLSFPVDCYEPFTGSGTTIIAAEQLGRRCYAMEISPAYCDVAVKRWENLTGRKASKG